MSADPFVLGQAQLRDRLWPRLSRAEEIQLTIHVVCAALIVALHSAVLAIRIGAALKRREPFWLFRVVHRDRGRYVVGNALLVYTIPALLYFVMSLACATQQRYFAEPLNTPARTMTAAFSAILTCAVVAAGWLSTASMLFSLLDSASTEDAGRSSHLRRLPRPWVFHLHAYLVPILATTGNIISMPFVTIRAHRLYAAGDELYTTLGTLVGTSLAAVPPATVARVTQLGAQLEQYGADVLLGGKLVLLQSMGFAFICLSLWPAITIAFLLSLRHIAGGSGDTRFMRLSLRTALSTADHSRANPSIDPRAASLRRRYQLVALQSMLFLVFAAGQACAGVLGTVAVFGGQSLTLTSATTQVVFWVDDVVILPLALVLLTRTIVSLRHVPESVGQPSSISRTTASSGDPATAVSLAQMLRSPMPPKSPRKEYAVIRPPSPIDLPDFKSESKAASTSDIGIAH